MYLDGWPMFGIILSVVSLTSASGQYFHFHRRALDLLSTCAGPRFGGMKSGCSSLALLKHQVACARRMLHHAYSAESRRVRSMQSEFHELSHHVECLILLMAAHSSLQAL